MGEAVEIVVNSFFLSVAAGVAAALCSVGVVAFRGWRARRQGDAAHLDRKVVPLVARLEGGDRKRRRDLHPANRGIHLLPAAVAAVVAMVVSVAVHDHLQQQDEAHLRSIAATCSTSYATPRAARAECERARSLVVQDARQARASARLALRDALVTYGGYVLCDNLGPGAPLIAVETRRSRSFIGLLGNRELTYPGRLTAPTDDLPTQTARYLECLSRLNPNGEPQQ